LPARCRFATSTSIAPQLTNYLFAPQESCALVDSGFQVRTAEEPIAGFGLHSTK
jgi:hypothetical protein